MLTLFLFPHSVSTRLQGLEQSVYEEVGISSHALQFRTLRLLSPPTKVKEANLIAQNMTSVEYPKSRSSVKETNAGVPTDKGNNAVPPGPSRRIRRPVMIRRPKLIGKSVDGAAMQAVAASRKRASSNQFKNLASSSLSRRGPNAGAAKATGAPVGTPGAPNVVSSDRGPKRLGRPPIGIRRQKSREDTDQELIRAKENFQLFCLQKYWRLKRPSML